MRKRAISVAVLAATVIAAPQALAFGTVRIMGQDAEHERITRQGLAGLGFGGDSLSELAGKNLTFGAVGAPDNPARGLMSDKAAHCDGGDFFDTPGYAQSSAAAETQLTACRSWIMAKIDDAVTDADGLVKSDDKLSLGSTSILGGCAFNGIKGRAKCNVLEDMGLVFHAAQDFYSHSNWVDAVRPTPTIANPAGLNNGGPAPWLSPAGAAFPAGLITGCYNGFPESLYCGGRIKHATLNKDTAGTTRGDYAKAMDVAAQDTRAKWTYFESQLVARYGAARGAKMACVIKSDSPGKC
jgi:hypothetical protein